MVAAKGSYLMLSLPSQVAQTPEFAKSFVSFLQKRRPYLVHCRFPGQNEEL
jgi:rhodanese-related sulfurtransferase